MTKCLLDELLRKYFDAEIFFNPCGCVFGLDIIDLNDNINICTYEVRLENFQFQKMLLMV